MSTEARNRVEQITLHLLHHPFDLIDTRRLMRRFNASPAEVQDALGQFSQRTEGTSDRKLSEEDSDRE
jgi:hypothetical protein